MTGTTAYAQARRTLLQAVGRLWRWLRGLWGSRTSIAAFTIAFVVFTLLSMGPLLEVDRAVDLPWGRRWPEARPVMETLVVVGQRVVCLPVLFAVALVYGWRRRSWLPVLLSVGAVVAVNFVVGALKLVTGRGSPRWTSDPAFFVDFENGILFPSGHSANVVLVFGLAAYLAGYYGGRRSRPARLLLALTVGASVVVLVTSVYLRGHWVSDLVAGYLVGGIVLQATIRVHAAVRRRRWHHRRRIPPRGPTSSTGHPEPMPEYPVARA